MTLQVHTLAPVVHASNQIHQITRLALSPGVERLLAGGNGQVNPGFVGIAGLQPELSFTTTALKVALAALGDIDGVPVAGSNLDFYFQKVLAGGKRAGATSHIKGTVVAGIIVPTTITIPQGQPATIDYRCVMISADGDAAPMAWATAQSLPTETPASEIYVLGGASLNGTDIDGVDTVTINLGIGLWVDGGSGKPYKTHVGISQQQPTIMISGRSIDPIATWDLDGQAQDASDSVITASALVEGGMVSGAADVTFTVDDGLMHYDDVSGSDGERLGGQITLVPTYDGTANIIAVGGLV